MVNDGATQSYVCSVLVRTNHTSLVPRCVDGRREVGLSGNMGVGRGSYRLGS